MDLSVNVATSIPILPYSLTFFLVLKSALSIHSLFATVEGLLSFGCMTNYIFDVTNGVI